MNLPAFAATGTWMKSQKNAIFRVNLKVFIEALQKMNILGPFSSLLAAGFLFLFAAIYESAMNFGEKIRMRR